MTISIAAPLAVVNNIANITKWAIVGYQDYVEAAVPHVVVLVQAIGNGGKLYGLYSLTAFDAKNSLCLMPNPSSTSSTDQLTTGQRQLVNAYTVITTAHDGATGNNKARLSATEAALLSTGLVDSALAGT